MHVPFCAHKCHYCDFYSVVDARDRQEAFVGRLERELAALAGWAGRLRTIFVGGGTPSLLRTPLWERVLRQLRSVFDLSKLEEFTVECNPESVTGELMGVLRAGGVTRVSMGAQSFERAHLKTLERWHDPERVEAALSLARGAGIARRSIDLIFGIPGQTLAEWERDLRTAVALGTEHVSCYSLTYEPNTAMTARLNAGEFSAMDEEVEVAMHRVCWRVLREAGLERYEVSNFAKAAAECRHNLAYWRQEGWLAAGPSGSAYAGGHRWKNVPRVDTYLEFDDAGFAGMVDHEGRDDARAIREQLMTGLRLREGVEIASILAEVARVFGARAGEVERKLRSAASRVAGRGWMEADADRWRLSDEGILFADAAARELMGTVPALA